MYPSQSLIIIIKNERVARRSAYLGSHSSSNLNHSMSWTILFLQLFTWQIKAAERWAGSLGFHVQDAVDAGSQPWLVDCSPRCSPACNTMRTTSLCWFKMLHSPLRQNLFVLISDLSFENMLKSMPRFQSAGPHLGTEHPEGAGYLATDLHSPAQLCIHRLTSLWHLAAQSKLLAVRAERGMRETEEKKIG